MAGWEPRHAHQRKIDGAIAYLRQVESRSHRVRHMHSHPRITLIKPLNDGRKNRCDGFRASDSDLPRCRVGQEFDFFDSLLQVVECRSPAFEQSTAIRSRLNALWAAIEQTYAERMFQVGDDL